jgi:predicted nucleic acid-binding protein
VYLDSAYIAKFYLNERDSDAVRAKFSGTEPLISSAWCLAEVVCTLHRVTREGRMTAAQSQKAAHSFLSHVDAGFWKLVPVTEALLHRVAMLVSAAPSTLFLRAGDAVHLMTAQDQGEPEIWTNDRHLLAAAAHFGLLGRSV